MLDALKSRINNVKNNLGLTDTNEDILEETAKEEGIDNTFLHNFGVNSKEKTSNTSSTEEFQNESEAILGVDCQTIFISPKEFLDCKKIANYIKNDKVVNLNLEGIEQKEKQRIIDFLSGAIKIKDAKWITISKNVYSILPKDMDFFYEGQKLQNKNPFLTISKD